MKRRLFTGAALAALGAAPLTARAQARSRLVGFLSADSETSVSDTGLLAAFRAGMVERGYLEPRDFTIVGRFADGNASRLPELARQLFSLRPDVFLTNSTPPTVALKQAVDRVPIVTAAVTDPVNFGLAVSEPRPGGRVTGVLATVEGFQAKKIEVLLEAAPNRHNVAHLINGNNPANARSTRGLVDAIATRGARLIIREVPGPTELTEVLQSLASSDVESLSLAQDPMFVLLRHEIADWALAHKMPTMFGNRENVDAGGFLSYGVSLKGSFRRAAYFVDRIFKGTDAAYLPFEFPNTLEFVINLKTAKALGRTLPESIMIRATEVIE